MQALPKPPLNPSFPSPTRSSKQQPHHQLTTPLLDEWHKRLSLPSSVLLYARDTGTPSTEEGPVGFILAHPKNGSTLPSQTLHIWLAGVTEQARGAGIFAALMMAFEQHARKHDIQELSVCTYPGKFAKMFAILQKTGWKVWAWMEGGEEVLMIKIVL
jgi:GNAT superfamily N-acetyltransferase